MHIICTYVCTELHIVIIIYYLNKRQEVISKVK